MPGIPTWAVGQVLTASDVNNWLVPYGAYKQTDQSLTSNTTLQNDNTLFMSVAASSAYMFWCFLDYEGGTQGSSDLKMGWTVPAGATMRYTAWYITTGGVSSIGGLNNEGTTLTAGTNGAAFLRGVSMMGTIVVSTTAGTLQLQWAQGTSSGTATIVHAQSALFAQRIA